MLHFATLFDRNFLARGMALCDSLHRHCPVFTLYVLCLDDASHEEITAAAERRPGIVPIHLREIEAHDPALKAARTDRSLIEYYFTLSPCLPLYVLKRYGPDHVCTLDADQLFFSDPTPLFGLLRDHSVLITAHDFSPGLEEFRKYGAYNVSFQIFKHDDVARGCLERWRSQCLDWCKDEYDEPSGRFADQKYLDGWPSLLGDRLHVFSRPGVGLAAWNFNRFRLSKGESGYLVDGQPLMLVHFHGFKPFSPRLAGNSFGLYRVRPCPILAEIYAEYWGHLREKQARLGDVTERGVRGPSYGRLFERLAKEKTLYFRFVGKRIRHVRVSKLEGLLARLLARLSAYPTRS
jgi:hypothetical protein